MDTFDGSHVDDILFTLRATHGERLAAPWDLSSIEATLTTAEKFAADYLAPGRTEADQKGCALDNGVVTVPASLERAYGEYVACGLHLLGLPEALGGLEAPAGVRLAVTELLAAADHSFQMLTGLTAAAADVIARHGPSDISTRLIAPLVSGETLATMCLTEPQAGSDLGAIQTTAFRAEVNWTLQGTKIFISGGGQSMSQSILHLVLARTGAGRDGRAALSLFAVPATDKVVVTRLEHKLGLRASPTCVLRFDAADAVLIGEEGQGLRIMFAMMNQARMDVAIQAVAHASAAGAIAGGYALERHQGRLAARGPVPIAAHGDVGRMLTSIAATALGTRAMCQLAVSPEYVSLSDFLTPVCKAFVTDRGVSAADTAIQVLGGYGYLPEYGVEQHWRDARITRIYEGTNGIMAMTLAQRLLEAENGALTARFEAAVQATCAHEFHAEMSEILEIWRLARSAIESAKDRGGAAYPFLTLTGHLWSLAAWAVLRANASLAPNPDRVRRLADFAVQDATAEAHALGRRVRDLTRYSFTNNSETTGERQF